MIGLVRAELLKLRRRWASYIVLGLVIGIMAPVFLLVAMAAGAPEIALRYPGAYGLIGEFVFGLGSLMAVAYAAAVAGADWSWGIYGAVFARGEGRGRYILAKALGLAIALAVGVVVAFGAGMAFTALAGTIGGEDVGDPFRNGPTDLATTLLFGYAVVAERAAIGFAVALLLRSQMAGVVAGIVLYVGESIASAILLAVSFAGQIRDGSFAGLSRIGPEWYQYLPFRIGDSVLAGTPGAQVGEGFGDFALRPVPLEQAIVLTLTYLVLALAIGVLSMRRAQISGAAG